MTTSRRAHLHLLCTSFVAGSLSACRKQSTNEQRSAGGDAAPKGPQRFRVGWTARPTWAPFKLIETEGFLAKRAKEFGVEIELVEFAAYMDSVQAFASGRLDGVTMSSPQLVQIAAQGKGLVATLPNAKCIDSHAIVVRRGDLGAIRGARVFLEQGSVSQYLFARALEKTGFRRNEVHIFHSPTEKIAPTYLSDPRVQAAATWEPGLATMLSSGKARQVFSCKNLPDEVVEWLAFTNTSLQKTPGLAKALSAAWFDAMAMLQNPSTRTKAIDVMARACGVTPKVFTPMLSHIELFTTPEQAETFIQSPQLKVAMKRVTQTSDRYQLIDNLNFGTTFGPGTTGTLRFDASYLPAQKVLAR